jgi:hypothetical protein
MLEPILASFDTVTDPRAQTAITSDPGIVTGTHTSTNIDDGIDIENDIGFVRDQFEHGTEFRQKTCRNSVSCLRKINCVRNPRCLDRACIHIRDRIRLYVGVSSTRGE